MIDSRSLFVESLRTLPHSHATFLLFLASLKKADVHTPRVAHVPLRATTSSKTLYWPSAFCQGQRSRCHCFEVDSTIAAIKPFLNIREHGRWSSADRVCSRRRASSGTPRALVANAQQAGQPARLLSRVLCFFSRKKAKVCAARVSLSACI